MKKILYFLLASLCISLQSCLYQEDNYFDDSSANRATGDVERCSELLKMPPMVGGWNIMPGRTTQWAELHYFADLMGRM